MILLRKYIFSAHCSLPYFLFNFRIAESHFLFGILCILGCSREVKNWILSDEDQEFVFNIAHGRFTELDTIWRWRRNWWRIIFGGENMIISCLQDWLCILLYEIFNASVLPFSLHYPILSSAHSSLPPLSPLLSLAIVSSQLSSLRLFPPLLFTLSVLPWSNKDENWEKLVDERKKLGNKQ